MNPEWLLVLAPVVGLGTFFLALYWPVKEPDGRNGLGVPDLEVRTLGCVPEDSQTDQETEEEQEMSNTNESFARSVALDRALGWAENNNIGADKILEVAEKFRAFLAGESVEELVFKLPRPSDQYLYFQYMDFPILYRANLNYMSDALGGVERISAGHQRDWRPTSERYLNTRQRLLDNPDYRRIAAYDAEQILREHVKGVRFE